MARKLLWPVLLIGVAVIWLYCGAVRSRRHRGDGAVHLPPARRPDA